MVDVEVIKKNYGAPNDSSKPQKWVLSLSHT